MKLSNDWFTSLSEDEKGNTYFINGRDRIMDFIKSGKFKERVEITWKYEGDSQGMPDEETAKLMEKAQEALQKAMEKDKLAIMTGIYTGNNERIWIFVTRNIPAFGKTLNQALAVFEMLPISIYTEKDPDNEEYLDLYQMKSDIEE